MDIDRALNGSYGYEQQNTRHRQWLTMAILLQILAHLACVDYGYQSAGGMEQRQENSTRTVSIECILETFVERCFGKNVRRNM